jgi:dTDP-4-amino-4,6-dideoxygalactose transaminase
MNRIPLAVPDLRGREAELLARCVSGNWVSSAGPEVTAFEAGIASLTGRKHAVAVVNGTAALHLALLAAGVKPCDRVVVPDWTFAATANAVTHARANLAFVDVTESDWALDPDLLTLALDADPTIRAVIAVDPLGYAADIDALKKACDLHDVVLIEDAAGAIGGRYKTRPCGSLGELSIFSFNGNKTLTAGGGGMVLTDDTHQAHFIRHISTQARPTKDYFHDIAGFNYRMTNLNAAVGLAQLERLDEMIACKRRISKEYDSALESREDIRPMPRPAHSSSATWLYSIRVPSEADAQNLVAKMEASNIEARIFWRSLSPQPAWRGATSWLTGVAASLSGTVVSLPCSSSLTREAQDRVIDVLAAWRCQEKHAA